MAGIWTLRLLALAQLVNVSTGQLTSELRDYLEIAYVSLADYLDDETAALYQPGFGLYNDESMQRLRTLITGGDKVSTG